MSTLVKSSLRKLAVLTAALIVVAIAVYFIKPAWVYPGVIGLFIFFVALSVGATFVADRATAQDPQSATNIYLGIMAGRLIISIIVLALFLFLDREHQYVFVGNFFLLYLCYAIFDITGLVANLRTDFRDG